MVHTALVDVLISSSLAFSVTTVAIKRANEPTTNCLFSICVCLIRLPYLPLYFLLCLSIFFPRLSSSFSRLVSSRIVSWTRRFVPIFILSSYWVGWALLSPHLHRLDLLSLRLFLSQFLPTLPTILISKPITSYYLTHPILCI